MTAEVWFPPNTQNPKIVGRFVDHVDTSRDVPRRRLVLETKPIGADSDSVSTRLVGDNAEGEKIKLEFSAAWSAHQRSTQAGEIETPVANLPDIDLASLEMDRTSEARLRRIGVTLVQQLAAASDAQCDTLGLHTWRQRARDLLALRAARLLATPDPSEALHKQLAEAHAIIAKQKADLDRIEAEKDIPAGWTR
jgi:hypothetical protein